MGWEWPGKFDYRCFFWEKAEEPRGVNKGRREDLQSLSRYQRKEIERELEDILEDPQWRGWMGLKMQRAEGGGGWSRPWGSEVTHWMVVEINALPIQRGGRRPAVQQEVIWVFIRGFAFLEKPPCIIALAWHTIQGSFKVIGRVPVWGLKGSTALCCIHIPSPTSSGCGLLLCLWNLRRFPSPTGSRAGVTWLIII